MQRVVLRYTTMSYRCQERGNGFFFALFQYPAEASGLSMATSSPSPELPHLEPVPNLSLFRRSLQHANLLRVGHGDGRIRRIDPRSGATLERRHVEPVSCQQRWTIAKQELQTYVLSNLYPIPWRSPTRLKPGHVSSQPPTHCSLSFLSASYG